MLELKTYTDDELIEALGISPSTLKCKRKVTEQRLLKDYEWSRDKKSKLYTIHSYKEQTIERVLCNTFETMIAEFSSQNIALQNTEKALRILVALYFTKENRPAKLSEITKETTLEISRYIKKFQSLDILVSCDYDYYLVDKKAMVWKLIDEDERENVKRFWTKEFFNWIDKLNVKAIDSDMEKVKRCKQKASFETVNAFGFLRKVIKKDMTNEAKEYFGPFLRYTNEQLNLMFEEEMVVTVD
ncbi:hypothetical protein [Bacillus cereus]|uniref:hypothetical protein n=1 Tax=Bacillus cereus TaxID=1396 RepID=UPI000BF323D5|nr:hypothetical protein [Bacillus cereus]PER08885.1 hypothetical protein CN489_24910 [Bacillus cereus]PFF53759.1 hypothetical protein CN350_27180 [Bacillus cereus]PGM85739.1 hypothetical protein CN956_00465 [Bacillus cereus]